MQERPAAWSRGSTCLRHRPAVVGELHGASRGLVHDHVQQRGDAGLGARSCVIMHAGPGRGSVNVTHHGTAWATICASNAGDGSRRDRAQPPGFCEPGSGDGGDHSVHGAPERPALGARREGRRILGRQGDQRAIGGIPREVDLLAGAESRISSGRTMTSARCPSLAPAGFRVARRSPPTARTSARSGPARVTVAGRADGWRGPAGRRVLPQSAALTTLAP
jgi:hypothetical protein